jgi:hypothetical protein
MTEFTTDELKEAREKISNLIADADNSIAEAVVIADKYGLSFNFDGPSYGMGGG